MPDNRCCTVSGTGASGPGVKRQCRRQPSMRVRSHLPKGGGSLCHRSKRIRPNRTYTWIVGTASKPVKRWLSPACTPVSKRAVGRLPFCWAACRFYNSNRLSSSLLSRKACTSQRMCTPTGVRISRTHNLLGRTPITPLPSMRGQGMLDLSTISMITHRLTSVLVKVL